MASNVTPSIPGDPLFALAMSYAARSVSILQTWTYNTSGGWIGLSVEGFPWERFVIHRGEQRRFAMAAPIRLREDFDGAQLRSLAKASKDAKQTRRLLALAVIYDGGSR